MVSLSLTGSEFYEPVRPWHLPGSLNDQLTSDGSIYRYRIDIAILGSRYYRIDIAILRSRYFCFRYSNMNTLISILIVKMQVSTINCLKFISIPTHWSVGRSTVGWSVGRSVGQLVIWAVGRSVGRSTERSDGHLNGLSVGQLVNWTVG